MDRRAAILPVFPPLHGVHTWSLARRFYTQEPSPPAAAKLSSSASHPTCRVSASHTLFAHTLHWGPAGMWCSTPIQSGAIWVSPPGRTRSLQRSSHALANQPGGGGRQGGHHPWLLQSRVSGSCRRHGRAMGTDRDLPCACGFCLCPPPMSREDAARFCMYRLVRRPMYFSSPAPPDTGTWKTAGRLEDAECTATWTSHGSPETFLMAAAETEREKRCHRMCSDNLHSVAGLTGCKRTRNNDRILVREYDLSAADPPRYHAVLHLHLYFFYSYPNRPDRHGT